MGLSLSLSDYREFVLYAGYALVGLSVFMISHFLLGEQEAMNAQENLKQIEGRTASNGLVKLTRPFFSAYIVPAVRSRKNLNKYREKISGQLISAGLKDELNADEFIAFKALLVVFFPIIGGLLKATGLMDLDLWVIECLPVVGFFYPDLWVRGRIADRQKQVLKSLPFVVDLLALSTEAGLDFIGAIQKVVEKAAPSPLIEELEQVLKEIKVGSSRATALRQMATRLGMQEINSFVAVLVSADQMGASIGKVLRQQSDQIRTLRFVRAEKAGATAVQKLFIPTFCLILPAIAAIMFGPFLLSAVLGGG